MAPLTNADLPWRYSIKSGAAGNSTAQGSGLLSLGKWISTTVWPGTLHSLFGKLESAENAGLTVGYRCVFAANVGGQPLTNPRVFLPDGDPDGGAGLAIALDPAGPSLLSSGVAQALENTNPAVAGLAWVSPTSYNAGLNLGPELSPGYCYPIWIRRTGLDSPALPSPGESIRLRLRGGTLG